MSDTSFRNWMVRLNKDKGARPEWPLLLSWMLEAEFHKQRECDRAYTGKSLLIDRSSHRFAVKTPEKKAAYGLCHRTWRDLDGCLSVGNMPVWLLSYEVPNFGSKRKQCADIVGLSLQGGLVVFEAKLGENGNHPPISAVLEGLDYLTCLMSPKSFRRMTEEVHELKKTIPVPPSFKRVVPKREAQPAVIVLADQSYFDFHDRSERSPGWREMVQYSSRAASISMRFARAELDGDGYFSRDVSWLS